MADFVKSIPITAEFEGAGKNDIFVNDPADPGGPTKCGITLTWAREAHLDLDHDGDIDVDDIRALTWDLAKPAYKQRIWDSLRLDEIIVQDVATKLFDLAVNIGPQRATRYFQRALNVRGWSLREDGILGNLTLKAINDCNSRRLLLEVCFIQRMHYERWCNARADREKFRRGLVRRAAWPFWDANKQAVV